MDQDVLLAVEINYSKMELALPNVNQDMSFQAITKTVFHVLNIVLA